MIVRILGDGQYEIGTDDIAELNILDAELQFAADRDDEAAFTAALARLLDAVRERGRPVPDERLVTSDLVLPQDGTVLGEVAALLDGEGLIPG